MTQNDTRVLSLENFLPEKWINDWEADKARWHRCNVNQNLINCWDKLCPPQQLERFIFVPLCGKSLDLEWLYSDKMCEVVGCDFAEKPLRDFCLEHPNLCMQESMVKFTDGSEVKMFHTPDRRLRLYLCDLFKMDKSSEKPFNMIWDRGSFVAINPSERTKYISLTTKLTCQNLRWLQETFDYPADQHDGTPCAVSTDEMNALFGTLYEFEILKYQEIHFELVPHATYFYERITLLTKKNEI